MAAPAAPITFPHAFPADISYRLGSILFSLVGVIGMGVASAHHHAQDIPVLALPFVVFLAAALLTFTFELTVDETGLHQRSILGRKDALWAQAHHLDQGRAYSLHGEDNRELVWLSLLSTAAQQAVAEETIRRAGLRPSAAKLEFPVRNQWVR